jgi:predicted pyridoxine 5'-phosphate oxidase superfamily flavin-nucleotide-binding protein
MGRSRVVCLRTVDFSETVTTRSGLREVLIASSDGAGSIDVSPKGDPPGFVRVLNARIVRDQRLRESMQVNGKVPELALVVDIISGYFHCAKCIIRSKLWTADHRPESHAFDTAVTARSPRPPHLRRPAREPHFGPGCVLCG